MWVAKQAPLVRYIKALGKFWLGLGTILVKIARGAINLAIAMLEGLLNGIKDTVQFFTGGYAGKAFSFFTSLLEGAGDAMLAFGKSSDGVAESQERVRASVAKLLEGEASVGQLQNAWWRLNKVGGHTAETLEDIGVRAMELEASGVKLTGGLQRLVDEMRETGDYLDDELDPIVEATVERWEKLRDTWKRGAIPEALAMMRALEAVGGITNLTESEQKQLNGALEAGILKYAALGEEAPKAMREIAAATREVLESSQIKGFENIWIDMYAMPGGFMASIDQKAANIRNSMMAKGGLPAFGIEIQGGISEGPSMPGMGAMLGGQLRRGFTSVIAGLPDTVIGAFKGGGGLFGAFKAIGAQVGSTFGGSIGSAWGAKIASKDGVGKLMKGFAGLAGPIGAAVGALAGPLISSLKKLFSGPTTQESVTKASRQMFGRAISTGLADAIAATRSKTESDFGAMMVHMADILNEMGGIVPNTIGIEAAIGRVRDIFVALETGAINTQQAAKSFDDSFKMIADTLIESGTIATEKFTELISLAGRFGTTAETIKFVGEQARLASVGIAAMFGPTIQEAKEYNEALKKNREAWENIHGPLQSALDNYEKVDAAFKEGKASQDELDIAAAKYNQTLAEYEDLAAEKIELDEKLNKLASLSAEELEDLGTIAVASFESAMAAGMSFTEAVEAHGPALDAIIDAQKELGIESDNAAIKELSHFQDRIRNNKGLVAAVDALDDTMLALSRTGSLNAETLGAMERQGIRMYDKLIEKGFTQEQAVLMMGPALKTIMEAHEKLGIPVDENTQKLIDQAKEAGLLETEQASGWSAITTAVGTLVGKMDELITRLMGVKDKVNEIPSEINIAAHVSYTDSGIDTSGQHGLEFSAAHGGIVTRPSVGLVGEAGPEAIIPLTNLESRDRALLAEVRGLKTELRNLPIHLRDAILLAQ